MSDTAQAESVAAVADWRPNERTVWRRVMLLGGGGLAALFFGLPVAAIFYLAFQSGLEYYISKVVEPATLHAIFLTVLTALVVVPINIGFGICAAWAITKHDFPGRQVLGALIDLPLSFSPVVAGVAYLFLYGAQGLLGPFLIAHDIQIMFTVPAIFLVSLFVTSPFVARALIPAMQSEGNTDEEAAISLGATGLQTFLRVSLPNIKWALLYGAVLCNARVMGEFGAVSVVSGKVRGQTNTLSLQIELLFNDFNTAGAFAAASTLTLLALVTLAIKTIAETRQGRVGRDRG
ncbi:MAG TPA: sulfate ABC transporter permease subunit CysW [Rhizomicrobium sp.]|nr:sulfate ABC transporter permease subunit CysW [Rhizomicrobium sp.]